MGEFRRFFQRSQMGQDGREEFSQQNGATYGFLDKFLNVANYSQIFVYFLFGTEKILYIFFIF